PGGRLLDRRCDREPVPEEPGAACVAPRDSRTPRGTAFPVHGVVRALFRDRPPRRSYPGALIPVHGVVRGFSPPFPTWPAITWLPPSPGRRDRLRERPVSSSNQAGTSPLSQAKAAYPHEPSGGTTKPARSLGCSPLTQLAHKKALGQARDRGAS